MSLRKRIYPDYKVPKFMDLIQDNQPPTYEAIESHLSKMFGTRKNAIIKAMRNDDYGGIVISYYSLSKDKTGFVSGEMKELHLDLGKGRRVIKKTADGKEVELNQPKYLLWYDILEETFAPIRKIMISRDPALK